MTRFRDVYAPSEMPGYPCISSPRTSTTITQSSSGAEHANQNWEHPLWRYTLPEAVRTHAAFEAVKAHWLVMAGPAAVVVAGSVTAWIAVRHADPVIVEAPVPANEHDASNAPALKVRNHAATPRQP